MHPDNSNSNVAETKGSCPAVVSGTAGLLKLQMKTAKPYCDMQHSLHTVLAQNHPTLRNYFCCPTLNCDMLYYGVSTEYLLHVAKGYGVLWSNFGLFWL